MDLLAHCIVVRSVRYICEKVSAMESETLKIGANVDIQRTDGSLSGNHLE